MAKGWGQNAKLGPQPFISEYFRRRGRFFKHYGVYVALAYLKKISRRRYFFKEKSAPSRRSLSCCRPMTKLEGQKRSIHFSNAILETSHSKWSTGILISFYLSLCDDDVVKLWYLILMVGEGISPCFHPFQYMMMKMMMRTEEDSGIFYTGWW